MISPVSASMSLYPAIDLLDGRCVRLRQGQFEERTDYSGDPVAVAREFEAAGAKYLHLVDLSGAKDPGARQTRLIEGIVRATGLKVQTGGGVRSAEQARELLAAGVDRVVIGSGAVKSPELVIGLLREFGAARVTVALDVRVDGAGVPRVALHGWKEQSAVSVAEALAPFLLAGLARVLCTDIALDGMMKGPNLALYQKLLAQFPTIEFQASGGMSRLEDLLALRAAGVRTAVIGKALYEGAIDLKEALSRC
jgi:phosphoribosylformimino-5-aminoimidazole carboxamide ribotide isomerase